MVGHEHRPAAVDKEGHPGVERRRHLPGRSAVDPHQQRRGAGRARPGRAVEPAVHGTELEPAHGGAVPLDDLGLHQARLLEAAHGPPGHHGLSTGDDVELKAGEAPYTKDFGSGRVRWGDYSATVVDPLNDIDMWTIQEYAATPDSRGDRWGTWWGQLIFGGAPDGILEVNVNPPSDSVLLAGSTWLERVRTRSKPFVWVSQPPSVTSTKVIPASTRRRASKQPSPNLLLP